MKSNRHSALALAVGLSSVALWCVWTGLGILFLYLMMFGDGAGGPGPDDSRAVVMPSLYLLLIAVTCLPFVRGWFFAGLGAIAHVGLVWGFWLVFHSDRLSTTTAAILALPFLSILAGWTALWCARMRTSSSKHLPPATQSPP